jgi:dienelactone hydrolase
MASKLKRDGEQWVFDWVIEQTGKTYHFAGDGRGDLPREVRSHAMIAKHTAKAARRFERLAQEAREAGHRFTALDLFFLASTAYIKAQHPLFETTEEKKFLHGRGISTYDAVRELSPYPVERIDVPWGEKSLAGYLHLCAGKEDAPLVFFIPGCDITKEFFPHPLRNPCTFRGMNIFSFDGPGQGEANIAGITLTPDNYERACLAALDVLVQRPDVNASKVVLLGISFGSYWAMRFAGIAGDRLVGVAAPWASVCDKRHQMETDSPRFKQLFGYLTGAADEDELDRFMAESRLDADALSNHRAPTLLVAGEYDPRSPLDEVLEFFDGLTVDKELWIFEDAHHQAKLYTAQAPIWLTDMLDLSLDWLGDRLDGKPIRTTKGVRRIGPTGSPWSADGAGMRQWYDGLLPG